MLASSFPAKELNALKRRTSEAIPGAIKTLYGLGISQAEIVRALDISRSPRVRAALKEARADFPTRPTGSARFAMQLQTFCALERRKDVHLSEEDCRVHSVLRAVLRIDSAFFEGLGQLALCLTMPQPPESDSGCWSLIRRVLQDQSRNSLHDYWRHLDRKGVYPKSPNTLRADMLRYLVEWCRLNIVHDWPQDGRMAIEWLLQKIDFQAAAIVRQRFGIYSGRALRHEEIAVLRGMSRWRSRKLEARGIRQLQYVGGKEFLQEIFLKPLVHLRHPITPAYLEELFDRQRADQCS